ncbi:YceI family protein [Staphylococcus gallinarum]|uniref:YceI family protein n=1 Tax=Staphylococcus gallinarum TaxID=1293 RepID=UPI001E3266BB|nr:YceI family protein [Staphylococcus gallinarum]MCD8910401.1 YceI family protein [Staphylococcus gallinarum]MEB7039323.1 YceI family protein [Staphylococcus gallinarum]
MTTFKFDQAHSAIEFSIKHLVISNVKGRFNDFDAQAEGDINDLSTLKGQFTIKADSIDTRVSDRDAHLKGEDFFDVAKYPEIKFEITNTTEQSVTGNLTIKGETNEETFDLSYEGKSKNPMNGAETVGFVINGSVNRDKYGITFNQPLETGGLMLGKEVHFQVSLEFALED